MPQHFESDTITRHTDEHGVCTVTLNRPGSLNALNGELVDWIWHTFYELAYDEQVRVVILTGAGEKGFCAGADLKERAQMSELAVRKRIDDYGRSFGAVAQLPKPLICAINGYAFGGGLELALCADIRLMAAHTRVGLTETKLGIIPAAGGTQRLARLVGPSRAKELIFTARRLDAQQAVAAGVVSEAVEAPALLERAHALAHEMLGSAPLALAAAKIAIDEGIQADLHTGLALEARAYAGLLSTQDRLEGLAAFKDRRPAQFKGR